MDAGDNAQVGDSLSIGLSYHDDIDQDDHGHDDNYVPT